tara:strand:+ start:1935 stop:2882 length:948 start_codon:yes stop_codon:yes gene_type:complete
MASIFDWSNSQASNASVGSINWAEGMAPSAVNDSARYTMADVAMWRDLLGGAKISSGTNTIALTSGLSLSAYAQGMMFAFEAGGANTGAATLNVDSIGAKDIKKYHDVALASGDLEAAGIYLVAYEATADNFQLLSAVSNAPMISGADSITIGSGTEVDTKIVFDGNAQDFYIGLDDSEDDLVIGLGSAVGTTPAISIDENQVTTFGKAAVGATQTASITGSTVLDFQTYQNFVLTATGNVTLANPSTEAVGQSGTIVFIQDGTGSRTLGLGTDYETVGGSGLTISTAANAKDIIPYFVIAANQIALGAPSLGFS